MTGQTKAEPSEFQRQPALFIGVARKRSDYRFIDIMIFSPIFPGVAAIKVLKSAFGPSVICI
jgi:hypothetical protein